LSKNVKEIEYRPGIELFTPSRNTVEISRYTDPNYYEKMGNFTYSSPKGMEFNETGRHYIHCYLELRNITLQKSWFGEEFIVYSEQEITEREMNQRIYYILFLFTSFGVFTGVYHLKKIGEGNSN